MLITAAALSLASCVRSSDPDSSAHPPPVVARDAPPTPAPDPGPPTPSSVVNGRFVDPVVLDGGGLRVDPPAPGQVPTVGQGDASQEIWASSTFSGYHPIAFGFGVVTITVVAGGVPAVHDLPAWVGFGMGALASCPAEFGPPPSQPPLPDSGMAAVVLGAADSSPVVAYRARSSICDEPATGPSVTAVDEVVSVPWVAQGALTDGALDVEVTLPPCGVLQGTSAGGTRTAMTITAFALVPADLQGCSGTVTRVTEDVQLSPPSNPGAPPPVATAQTAVLHGALGPTRQAS